MTIPVEAPSSSVVYWGLTGLLPMEGPMDAPTAGLTNSSPLVAERSGGGPATRVNPEVGGMMAHGWNGLAAADRVEFNLKAKN